MNTSRLDGFLFFVRVYGSSQGGQRVKGYPSFDSEYTAILDLTKRRQIDAVRRYKWFSSCSFSSPRYGF